MSGFEAQAVDQLHERAEVVPGLAGHGADRCIKTRVAGARRIGELLERARANAARREIDDAQERGVVCRILDQSQVRERVLDLGALEKPQPAIDAVRNRRIEQRMLDHA